MYFDAFLSSTQITGNSQNNCIGTCTKVQLRFGYVKKYYHMFATQGRFLKLRPIKKLNFTFLMAHTSEILIKKFMILEHYTQLAGNESRNKKRSGYCYIYYICIYNNYYNYT